MTAKLGRLPLNAMPELKAHIARDREATIASGEDWTDTDIAYAVLWGLADMGYHVTKAAKTEGDAA